MTPLQAYLNSPRARKALSKKPGEEGFSLIELVVVVAVLAVLSAIAIPSFMSIADKARSAAAANTVAQVAIECGVNMTIDPDNPQPTIIISYLFKSVIIYIYIIKIFLFD